MSATNYPLYVHWYQTLDWILDSVERMPKKVRFTIATRIADISLQILEQIVEAIYLKERVKTLNGINLNLEKLRVLFRLSHDRQYLSTRQFEYIAHALNEAGKMAGGWLKHGQASESPV